MARDIFEFVIVRVVAPALVLGAIGGVFYLVERCSAEEPTAASRPAEPRPAADDAGVAQRDGGLTPEQRERIRRALARLDGSLRPDPVVPMIPGRRQ